MNPSQLLLLVLCLAVCSCNGKGPVDPGSVSSSGAGLPLADSAASRAANELLMTLDEVVVYNDLQLRWINLDDSRCAIGVTCVWEGEAVATIEVARNGAQPEVVEVALRAGSEPAGTAVAGYLLSVLDVSPHPEQNVTPERSAFTLRLGIKPL
jgi:hypothetical protein